MRASKAAFIRLDTVIGRVPEASRDAPIPHQVSRQLTQDNNLKTSFFALQDFLGPPTELLRRQQE